MPPLPADSIHARACKLKCEKILTRPLLDGVRSKKLPVFQRDTMPFALNHHAMIYTN